MKEKAALIEKIRKSIWETTLAVICTTSFILAIISSLSFNSKTGFYIFALITALAIMGVYSVYIYKKETSDQGFRRKLKVVIRIIWNYTMLVSGLVVFYKITFSIYIPQDKSYWIYDLIAIYIMLSIVLKYIIRFLKERKRIIGEKDGILSHYLNILYTVWMIFFLNNFSYYLFYMPIKTMDLDNAPKPYYLYVSEYRYKEFKSFSPEFRSIEIDDDKLLEKFTDELSRATIKNMRGVEYMMEEGRARDELYYSILTQYKDPNGIDIERPYIFDKMYFSEMKLYRNGDLILKNHMLKHKFPFPNYRTDFYKVTLSQELTDQIIGQIKNIGQGMDNPSIKVICEPSGT